MSYLFQYSYFNGDISRWDVSNIENMHSMFYAASFNGDISQWDVSNVNTMEMMFFYSGFNNDISHWDVSNVTEYSGIFTECPIEEKYKPKNLDYKIEFWNLLISEFLFFIQLLTY